MAYILYESASTSLSTYDSATDTRWESQSFTPDTTHTLKKVELYGYRDGNPGDVTVEIYASTTDDKPTGSALASTTFDGDSLGTSDDKNWISIVFSTGYMVQAGTKYCIVAKALNGDSDNKVYLGYSTSSIYSDGKRAFSDNSGSNWFPQTTHDFWFKEYADAGAISSTAQLNYDKALVAISYDSLYYESSEGTMSQLAASDGELDGVNLQCNIVSAFQKVFIANKSNLKVADFVNSKLTTSDIGSHPPDKGNVLTGGASGAKMTVDYITALSGSSSIYGNTTTTATFSSGETVTGTDDDGNSISFDLSADEATGPLWYNWTIYGNDSSYGSMPDKATLICNYRGRIVLSGNENNPHQWYMARQGNSWDFNYLALDAQAPVAGNNADAGEIGDVITALIPFKDDVLVFGCSNSVWYLAGDPAAGGAIDSLDTNTGIYGAQSWCIGPEDDLYFWGDNGLYRTILPDKPVCISKTPLPTLVTDESVNPNNYRITMGYDSIRNGILICITKIADGTNSNYFYDINTEGFFPESYPSTCGVYAIHTYNALNPNYKKLVLGCDDGYLRYFKDSAKSDDSGASDTAIDSYCTIGIYAAAKDNKSGKVNSFEIIPGGGGSSGTMTDSDDISYKIYTALTGSKILEDIDAGNRAKVSGTVKGPGNRRNASKKQKIRDRYFAIYLYNNTSGEAWSFEKLLTSLAKKGRNK